MPRKAKRRFLGVEVDEVSLVDSPANEVEFLVTKNLEDDDMAAVKKQEGNEETTKGAEGAERVAVEQPAGTGADVAKAMEHVNSIVDTLASLAGVQKADDKTEETETETTKSDEDVEKGGMSMDGMLKALGLSADQMKAAKAKMKAMGFDPSMKFPTAKPPVGDGAPTKKAADEDDADALGRLAAAITKAKQFTPSRIAKLKEAFEVLKLVIAEVAPDESPSTTVPTSPPVPGSGIKDLTSPSPAPVIKSADDLSKTFSDLRDVLKSMKENQDKLAERLDAVEKARPASNSLDDEGKTDTKTQKSGNIWSGIL